MNKQPPSLAKHANIYSTILLLLILSFSAYLHFSSLTKDLPFKPENDELYFVPRAAEMAAEGRLNPEWFGHPGSTVLYPLALLYHLSAVANGDGQLFSRIESIAAHAEIDPTLFYLQGRTLTTIYALVSIVVLYVIGQRLGGNALGLMASWLFASFAIALQHATTVRTDSAAVCFGLLSLLGCLLLLERTTMRRVLCTGIVIGLAVATRYFMIALLPCVLLSILWSRQTTLSIPKHKMIVLTLCTALLTFVISTPFFFIDVQHTLSSLAHEARTSNTMQPVTLSPLGNLLAFITSDIPRVVSWPQCLAALAGAVLAYRSRDLRWRVLIAFAVAFLIVISAPALHWQWWLIPVLPVLALLTAIGLQHLCTAVSHRAQFPRFAQALFLTLITLSVSVMSNLETALSSHLLQRPSTSVTALAWLHEHVPAGSKVAVEWLAAPVQHYPTVMAHPLPARGTLSAYRAEGVEVLVVNQTVIDATYVGHEDRFPAEAAFYAALEREARLLQEIKPQPLQRGSVIRIYEL